MLTAEDYALALACLGFVVSEVLPRLPCKSNGIVDAAVHLLQRCLRANADADSNDAGEARVNL